MQRLRELYRKRTDLVSVCIISAAFAVMIAVILFLIRHGVVWGSETDWCNQHIIIPEYFRQRFYSDHDIFPDFAMQLGGGQNIYNFAYYGLLNPLYLPAYLLPQVSMSTYIPVVASAAVLVSSIMSYYLFKRHFNGVLPLVLALMFVFNGAILFHSHRHIMFIDYLPFEMGLLLLFGGKNSPRNSLLTALMTFCVMCTSFYYSIGAFAAVGAYLVFNELGKSDFSLREIAGRIGEKILFSAFGCICAAILWLPTLSAIVSGREETATDVPLSRLLIPSVDLSIILYSPYTSGVTSLILLAALYLLKNGRKQFRFISIIILCFTSIRLFCYLLNGMMYIDGKAFIPFVPLFIIAVGGFLDLKEWKKPDIYAVLAVYAVLVTISLLTVKFSMIWQNTLIIEALLTIAVVIVLSRLGRERCMTAVSLTASFIICIMSNNLEHFVTRSKLEAYKKDTMPSTICDTIDGDDEALFRFADTTSNGMNVNRICSMRQLSTNMYSSISNADYRDFRFDYSLSENRIRNNAFQVQPRNSVFNALMGCRYRISDDTAAMLGETEIKVSGEYRVFSSSCALPLGYASSSLLSEKTFYSLPEQFRAEALLENIITPEGGGEWHQDDTEDYPLDMSPIASDTRIDRTGGVYVVSADEDFSLSLPLPETINGDILLITVECDNRIGRLSEQADVALTINGVKNKLTDQKWKYNNKNYHFTYTISSAEPIESLSLEFTAGNYTLSDFRAYVLSGDVLRSAPGNTDGLNITHVEGDRISGTVNARSDGWFTMSFPYDNGFHVKVDGIDTAVSRTNTAFIGFPLSAGEHSIDVVYEAPMKKTGIAVSAAGAFVTAAAVCIELILRKKRQNSENRHN